MPWQAWLLVHMLELNEDGALRFRTVVVLVARQNGKSTLAQILTIWLMCVWGWPLVLGTAQDLDVAETLWQEVVDIVQENEDLAELVDRVVKVNGKKALELTTGQKYKVKAANSKAGRGLSGNLVLLDELRTHKNWNAWAAITKSTLARAEALILALSNAGDLESVVLKHLRIVAHRAIGDPDGIWAESQGSDEGPTQFDIEDLDLDALAQDEEGLEEIELEDLRVDESTIALFEWSAAPGCSKHDRDAWAQASPSMNRTDLTERNIAAALSEPDYVFRTEILCQWPDGTSSGPFVPGTWGATRVDPVKKENGTLAFKDEDRIVGPVLAAIDQSHDRSMTYISFAGYRKDGRPQAEVITGRYGTDWVAEWLQSPKRNARIKAVTGQSRGAPVSTLMKQLADDRTFRLPIVELAGADLTTAYAEAFDAVRDCAVVHPKQPTLDNAAETAVVKYLSGGTWVIDRKDSPTDAAPLISWIEALWLLNKHVPDPPPPPPAPEAVRPTDIPPGAYGADLTSDLATAGF
ncbi:terminase large subunit domain-containing protein [Oerskovia sp. NPDC057915]|uniref:terminase large subunit domain-containing protein n=1 Tax=Oerskovia sp. NPDC057915 TaxID=3346280 RepID=UPI0036D8D8AB